MEPAGDSRSHIITRRGAATVNLEEYTIENGDMTLDVAFENDLWTNNCTHAVGIATTTEVGLTSDRFPIRFVVIGKDDVVDDLTNETCVKYWCLRSITGEDVLFSRKPLVSNDPIVLLYACVPDLDDKLWDHYRKGQALGYLDERHNVITDMAEDMRVMLAVPAPTAEQRIAIANQMSTIITEAERENRFAYFHIEPNMAVHAVPAGRDYVEVDGLPAGYVALYETALCLATNYKRMKARYNTLSDGIVSLAAYAVAAMFRNGLVESYENREYYTVFVVPTSTTAPNFKVRQIVAPPGCAALTDITVGMDMHAGNVRLRAQHIEIANLLVVAAGLMHYLFNHTTGGTLVTGTLLTVLAMYGYVQGTTPRETHVLITSLLYETLHPVNKRAVANIFFDKCGVHTHSKDSFSPAYEKFVLDSFMKIRTNPYPAGSHKAFIAIQGLRRILNAGLAPFLPWADRINELINMCKEVLMSGARAHIGSHYYTGQAPLVQPAAIDEFLPDIAMYVHIYHRGDSLSMSPHMSSEHARKSASNWSSLLKGLKAADVSATPIDKVRQFLATSGAVHFTFDPDDQATWATAVNDCRSAAKVIDSVFMS